jgi:putative toxin-antitoxin system antitoxin component (TIGR02293 family)
MAQAHSAFMQIESDASAQWERKRNIPSGVANVGRSGAVRNLVGLSLKAHRGISKAEATQLFQRIAATSSLPVGKLRAELIPDSSWKRAGQRLGPQASQTAARLMHILSVAERVWGNETDATEWLNGPHPELRGATPLSLLKTEAGGRVVEALLGALEFGFPV